MRPGQRVRCEITKWGDRPHWTYEGVWLGTDEHGEWLGFPVGTLFARPGHRFVTAHDQVGLVPAARYRPGGWPPCTARAPAPCRRWPASRSRCTST